MHSVGREAYNIREDGPGVGGWGGGKHLDFLKNMNLCHYMT